MTEVEEKIQDIMDSLNADVFQLTSGNDRMQDLRTLLWQARAAARKEQSEWISVDEPPTETGEYIIAYGDSTGGAWWDNDLKEFEDWEDNIIHNVSHWQPIPEPPK